MILSIIYIILGFALLIKGGDWLVDGAVNIARYAGLSAMVIGITVVGFGTSAPELFVSLDAAIANSPSLCIGNVVGSNIANIALILGATALIRPCRTAPRTLWIDVPMMVLACWLLASVGMSGTINRLAGIIGFLILALFVGWEIRHSRKQTKRADSNEEICSKKMSLKLSIGYVVIAFALLAIGARLLINGASDIARHIGQFVGADPIDMERIIGLTIVAVGTSLPELFASLSAACKKQQDLAVGNVVGSVTFNILCGIGLPAIVCPINNSDKGFMFDYLLMGGLALLLWLFMYTTRSLNRWEGSLLVLIYVLYIARTIAL